MSARAAELAPERRLARAMAAAGLADAEWAFVLGSGLGVLAERLEDPVAVPFAELEGMPRSAVPGHAGRFVVGTLAGRRVLCQQGRVHLYEGWSAEEVTRAVRALAWLGREDDAPDSRGSLRGLVLTNAAGGLVPEWPVPTLMRLTDHLNLSGRTPLRRGEGGVGSPYEDALGARLDAASAATGVALQRGVYVGLLGPSYETAAEIRHLARCGAQAVGMSTVCEALAAHAEGLPVAAVSCISNPAAGIATGPLNHEEVVEAGRAIAEDFVRLLTAFAAGT